MQVFVNSNLVNCWRQSRGTRFSINPKFIFFWSLVMSTDTNYEAMKVGQLRALCKLRGINSDDKKDELIAALIRSDAATVSGPMETADVAVEDHGDLNGEDDDMTADEVRELEAIMTEMRKMRKEALEDATNPKHSKRFVHKGYGTSHE
jgi:hypothetical protein